MASSAPDICEEERCESAVEVDRKAEILADRIRASKHFVAFTGAGISTSAGRPSRPSVLVPAQLKSACFHRHSRFPRSGRRLDALGPGEKTVFKGHRYVAGYPDAYTHGSCGAAEPGHDEIPRQPKLRWLAQEERNLAGKKPL